MTAKMTTAKVAGSRWADAKTRGVRERALEMKRELADDLARCARIERLALELLRIKIEDHRAMSELKASFAARTASAGKTLELAAPADDDENRPDGISGRWVGANRCSDDDGDVGPSAKSGLKHRPGATCCPPVNELAVLEAMLRGQLRRPELRLIER